MAHTNVVNLVISEMPRSHIGTGEILKTIRIVLRHEAVAERREAI